MQRPRSVQHLHAATHGPGSTHALGGGTVPPLPPGYLASRAASQPIAEAVVNDAVASITGLPVSQVCDPACKILGRLKARPGM